MDKTLPLKDASGRTAKRIDMVANGFILFSGLWLLITLVGILQSTMTLDLTVGIEAVVFGLQCLLALGLLRRNKVAYYASIVFGIAIIILSVITPIVFGQSLYIGVYMLGALPFLLFSGSGDSILTLLWFLSFVASFVLWIYLLFRLNSKLGKGVFQIK